MPPQLRASTQQTPNPSAQVPLAVPPTEEHSSVVKHVPFCAAVDEAQASFANLTTLKIPVFGCLASIEEENIRGVKNRKNIFFGLATTAATRLLF